MQSEQLGNLAELLLYNICETKASRSNNFYCNPNALASIEESLNLCKIQ